jgi:hypothetical protein
LEMLGERPLFVTLTYPARFGRWGGNADKVHGHLENFQKRWTRAFGKPMGFWVLEFQVLDGRPHFHLLVKAPESLSDGDYAGLQALARLSQRNQKLRGKYEGRGKTPPTYEYGGEFGREVCRMWSDIVTGNHDRDHYVWGVQVRPCFYDADGRQTREFRRAYLADYMARETGKESQKVPAVGFGPIGRHYGIWGAAEGFRPVVAETELGSDVAERLLGRLQAIADERGIERSKRAMDGLRLSRLGPEDGRALLAEAVAESSEGASDTL